MTPAALILSLPIALDGESVSANNAAIAAVSLVSIIGGYVMLAMLWHFVFRDRGRGKRKDRPE